MSKAIRWQVPFASISGTKYRVDIYDEGYTGTPVQLLAGETPFVTEEDSSEDFFAPIRTQTGTLQICTALPDGGRISLDELLPANNIARPIRLINLDNSNAIEWQGFLSCEAYSQNYTSIPENLSLPVISILEAMASVQLDPTRTSGLQPIYVCLPDILQEIDRQSGITCFTHLNYSRTDYRIISKYIDMTVMFERKEYNNENSTTYIVSGLSAKDALERLCTYMGWIAREKGSEIYLQRIGEEIGMFREEIDEFPGVAQNENITEAGIAATFADKWRGTDHKRTISQGAKSVEVVAKLEKYQFDLELPESPLGNTSDYTVNMWPFSPSGITQPVESKCNRDNSFTNYCVFKCYKTTSTGGLGTEGTIDNILGAAIINPSSPIDPSVASAGGATFTYFREYAGAFMARIKSLYSESDSSGFESGLYIVGIINDTNTPSASNHIFEMNSMIAHTFKKGKLVLKFKGRKFYSSSYLGGRGISGALTSLRMCIKLGDYYWNGTGWVNSFAYADVQITDADVGYEIAIDNNMAGEVSVRIFASSLYAPQSFSDMTDMYVTELSIDYQMDEGTAGTMYDRGENNYFRLLGTNFRDEISVNTDLASTLNNEPSPSLIMNSETEAMTELNYGTDQVPDMRRPEVDLLNRLATYYGAARQRLELIVAHPTGALLPLLKLNGINDGKVYLPLAESRNWQQEVSTLTCFEAPEEPSES